MLRLHVVPQQERVPAVSVQRDAQSLSARLPHILLEARRISASLNAGLHGRRRSGPGETFWQFRPYMIGESVARIDWRRSAREDKTFIREREWEAAHSIHLWVDRSASMGFGSSLAPCSKIDRALVLGLALADSFVEAGERVGMLGLQTPTASRHMIERMALCLMQDQDGLHRSLPYATALKPQDDILLISDFLSPLDEIQDSLKALSKHGTRGHLVMVADPVEESFPFSGQAILQEIEGEQRLVIGDAAAFAELYRERLARHREGISALVQGLGWTFTLHRTDRSVAEIALKMLNLVVRRGTA
jgi:uncharacterized protein (DUF58 family)